MKGKEKVYYQEALDIKTGKVNFISHECEKIAKRNK